VVCGLSLYLVNPPAGYVPQAAGSETRQQAAAPKPQVDAKPSEMMRTGSFYLIWFIYFIGAGAGLMVIGSVAGMARRAWVRYAFIAVAIFGYWK